MPSSITYKLISSTTLTSNETSVTFSSIPSIYTDLIFIFSGGVNTGTANLDVQFNNDTASNYSLTLMNGDGTSAISQRLTNQTTIRTNDGAYLVADLNTMHIVDIMDYKNTTTYKTLLSKAVRGGGGLGGAAVAAVIGTWRSTSAITSIKLSPSSNSFSSGSTFRLYGVGPAL